MQYQMKNTTYKQPFQLVLKYDDLESKLLT